VRLADILKFAVSALVQQKVRTLLTTLGVVISTFVLVLSLSIGQGVREVVARQFRRNDQLRRIEVYPVWAAAPVADPVQKVVVKGRMSTAKRRRIRAQLMRRQARRSQPGPEVPLNQERLRRLAHLPHVRDVVPSLQLAGRALWGEKVQDVFASAANPDPDAYRHRLLAGAAFTRPRSRALLVSEFLLYRWGVADEDRVPAVLGRTVRLEFRSGPHAPNMLLTLLNAGREGLDAKQEKVLAKAVRQLPEALDKLDLTTEERETLQKLLQAPAPHPHGPREVLLARDFTIGGVFRNATEEEARKDPRLWDALDEDILLAPQTAVGLFFRHPYLRDGGTHRATVVVDEEANVKEVVRRVEGLGLRCFALVDILERVQTNILLISFATAFVAGVALLVAALGIVNTMLITVLERTHEIGVMKAVGARDGHIQVIFLVEGLLIGLVGGGVGLLLSWAASIPGDAVARSMMQKQTNAPLADSLFVFPAWLTAGIPLFAGLVTTLAAVLPARRAARVSPITALRHE
jgi:putative ABC transport system permease protein